MNKSKFYNASHIRELEFVPFDIETTGFFDEDVITTFTLLYNGTYTVWLNTEGRDHEDSLEDSVATETGYDIDLRAFPNDGDLLADVRRFLMGRVDKETGVIVAYNGEIWNGGFDLRFIRSRCLVNDVPFPFSGYGYTDLMPVFGKHDRFNVTHPAPDPDLGDLFNKGPLKAFADHLGVEYSNSWNKGKIEDAIEDHGYADAELQDYCEENGVEAPTVNPSGLVQVYERIARLRGWDDADVDPFGPDESKKAVQAYHDGDFEAVILHNLADVHKTGKLTQMVVESKAVAKNEYEPTFFPAD